VKLTRVQLAGLAIAIAVVLAGKHYYRNAGADELGFLLAPTAKMVSIVTDTHFVREAGVGYVDQAVAFEIAPVCAGLNFLLAGVLALAIGWLGGMTTWRAMAKRLVLAVGVAYVATLVTNTIRIAIAIRMHESNVSGAEMHRLEGVLVYLGGLCALYKLARKLENRHATS
jgi:exosortase K